MDRQTQFFTEPTVIQEAPKKKKTYQVADNPSVEPTKAKSSVAVHRCKFLEWQPEGVIALAYNPNLQLIAVARENCDIELWRRFSRENWWPERRLTADESLVPKSMIWIKNRLFSAGLFGKITEWSLDTLQEKKTIDSYGGPVWQLAASPDGLSFAAACDDGAVHLFSIADDNLEHRKSIAGVGSRLLSVCYHPTNPNELYTGGSDGSIRRIDISQNRVLIHTNVGLNTKGHQKQLWTIAVLEDHTVISGDSSGATEFWSGLTGTVIQSFKDHLADILAIAVDHKKKCIYVSGVDSRVSKIDRSSNEKYAKWTSQVWTQKYHSHDVRSIVITDEFVISGGMDTLVVICDHEGRFIQRKTGFPQRSVVSLSQEKRMISAQFSHSIQLWKIGTTSDKPKGKKTGTALSIEESCQLLLEMNLKCSTNLIRTALSPNGNLIAASDAKTLKLFAIVENKQTNPALSVQRLKLPSNQAAYSIIFTHDSSQLIIATLSREVVIYDVSDPHKITESGRIKHDSLPDVDKPLALANFEAPIHTLAVSKNNRYLAVGDIYNITHIYRLKDFERVDTLPIFPDPIRTFSFHPELNHHLVIAFSNNGFVIYDVKEKKLAPFSRTIENQTPPDSVARKNHRILGITFNPKSANQILMWAETFFVSYDITKDLQSRENPYPIDRRYKPVLFFDFLSQDELVVVERPWQKVYDHMPGTFDRPRYGT